MQCSVHNWKAKVDSVSAFEMNQNSPKLLYRAEFCGFENALNEKWFEFQDIWLTSSQSGHTKALKLKLTYYALFSKKKKLDLMHKTH